MSNKGIWAALLAVVILTGAAISYLSIKLVASERFNSEIGLEAKCSEWAGKFFKENEYGSTSQGLTNSYRNHWNKKLSKCFVQITSISLKDNFLELEVVDPLESKRYALFDGH